MNDHCNNLYTEDMIEYVNRIDSRMWKEALLHQIRLRDIMEKDRDIFEKMYNDLCIKYNQQSDLIKHLTMRNPLIIYENRIEELSKIKRKDYKSTIWSSPEDEVLFLLKEIDKVKRMKEQGIKF